MKQTQSKDSSKDGMDMALLVFENNSNTVQFCGANNPLYRVSENGLDIVKANRNPVSILSAAEQKEKLNAAFDEWTNGYEQLDDVLVIGIRAT